MAGNEGWQVTGYAVVSYIHRYPCVSISGALNLRVSDLSHAIRLEQTCPHLTRALILLEEL